MSSEPLDRLKDRIKTTFLGRAGIHGVGLKNDQVRIYATKVRGSEQKEVLESIRQQASPAKVDVVYDEAPMLLNKDKATKAR